MSGLEGEQEEWRRILHHGVEEWVRPDHDQLVLADRHTIAETEAIYLPPCNPTKIICIHLNYASRRAEFGVPTPQTPTYF